MFISNEWKVSYKVGCTFKGCQTCGEYHIITTRKGQDMAIYTSGTDVRRFYNPAWHGVEYWCPTCGATDGACWGVRPVGFKPHRRKKAKQSGPPVGWIRGERLWETRLKSQRALEAALAAYLKLTGQVATAVKVQSAPTPSPIKIEVEVLGRDLLLCSWPCKEMKVISEHGRPWEPHLRTTKRSMSQAPGLTTIGFGPVGR